MKNNFKKDLELKRKNFQEHLIHKREELTLNLKTLENEQIKQLHDEILLEIQHCPDEFVNYFKQKNYSIVAPRLKDIAQETEKLWKRLEMELIGTGIGIEKYFEVMDKSTKNASA